MSCLSSLGSNQLIIIASLVSILISDKFSADDLDILAAFITSVGDLLALKATKLSIEDTKDDSRQQILLLEEQIKRLEDKLK
ncbi:MAG: hypothetical protein GXY86_01645 [Firmicutes bacterium]|nr:hypothetical protein [Bacillota bacterium]